jgi:hypothetical protein
MFPVEQDSRAISEWCPNVQFLEHELIRPASDRRKGFGLCPFFLREQNQRTRKPDYPMTVGVPFSRAAEARSTKCLA